MLKAIDKWLPAYLGSALRRPRRAEGPRHLLFCVADHYEPLGRGVDRAQGLAMVDRWVQEYPSRFEIYRDADGRPPCHSIFYPAEEYDSECLDRIGILCEKGFAEVEVHLHHRDDTAHGLAEKLTTFRDTLHYTHGMLGADRRGDPRYGFIHGNWALCNSRPDGDWCGVNEEIDVLLRTGCYADFTFPSAPSATQPRMVNAIYRAENQPGKPRSHDRGRRVCAGSEPPSEVRSSQLLLVTGPLALNWRTRKWGLLPRVENGDITEANPPIAERAALWAKQHIHVRGRADWVMVKVHTHGCVEANASVLLGESMEKLHETLKNQYNDGSQWCLHYVSAREMANIVLAAESGCEGNPHLFRDHQVFLPEISGRG
jgi:hypothetical protein